MWLPIRNLKPSQAVPRMLADLISLHACMIGALATPILYLTLEGRHDLAAGRLAGAMAYYSSAFVLLSFVFPIIFLLNGFFTRSRAVVGHYNILVILRGARIRRFY